MNKASLIKARMDLSGSHWGHDLTQGPDHIEHQGGLANALCRSGFQHINKFGINCSFDPKELPHEGIEHLWSIQRISNDVRNTTLDIIQNGRFPILLGGEQTVDLGFVSAFAMLRKRIGIISLDGHFDCNTQETSNTGHVHGQTMASHCGHGNHLLRRLHIAGIMQPGDLAQRVLPEDVLIIGPNVKNEKFFAGESSRGDGWKRIVRSEAVQQEIKNAEDWGIRYWTADQLEGLSNVPRDLTVEMVRLFSRVDVVLVINDLDHMRQEDAPGVAMRNPEGLRTPLSLAIAREIASIDAGQKKLGGVALVEVDKAHDVEDKTAKVAAEFTEIVTGSAARR